MASSSIVEIDPTNTAHEKNDIPFFGSQQLNSAKWPTRLNYPLNVSPIREERLLVESQSKGTESDWSDEEDVDAPIYTDPADFDELMIPISSGNQTPAKPATKRKISGESDGSNAGDDHDETPKKAKLAGGYAALPKKVTADLDSEDEIIMRMKNAKYQEKDIAKYLADRGGTKYHPKTIGTRWTRLKRKLAERQDELLDADLSDWHAGDDDALCQAVALAESHIKREIQKIEEKKDRYIADFLKYLKPVTNFSQQACNARLAALKNGTAKPTPESIVNPDASTRARILDRQAKEAELAKDNAKVTRATLNSYDAKVKQISKDLKGPLCIPSPRASTILGVLPKNTPYVDMAPTPSTGYTSTGFGSPRMAAGYGLPRPTGAQMARGYYGSTGVAAAAAAAAAAASAAAPAPQMGASNGALVGGGLQTPAIGYNSADLGDDIQPNNGYGGEVADSASMLTIDPELMFTNLRGNSWTSRPRRY